MARLIPAAERITRARKLIQKACNLPVPEVSGESELSYIAGVKDILRQARDLVKFITYTVGSAPEVKQEAEAVLAEIEQAEKEILHK